MKKIIVLILSLLTICCLSSCMDSDSSADISWEIDDNILYINGHGAIPDYEEEDGGYIGRPWENDINNIMFIEIGDGITGIGDNAFAGAKYLVEVKMPDSVKSIGEYAFKRCICLGDVFMSKNITVIEDGAFENCYSLSEISLPSKLNTIGEGAFERCITLKEIDIPKKVKSIGKDAFLNCEILTTVNYEGSVKAWSKICEENVVGAAVSVKCSDGNAQ